MEVLSEGELLFRHTMLVRACFGEVVELGLTAGPTALVPTETAVGSGSPLVEHGDRILICLCVSGTKKMGMLKSTSE